MLVPPSVMSHLLIKPGLGASCRDGYREGEKLFLGGSVSVSVISVATLSLLEVKSSNQCVQHRRDCS